MSKRIEEKKLNRKIIIIRRCLNMLLKPLRNIITSYLQYEEALRMYGFLGSNIPVMPILTVETMFKDKIFYPPSQPLSSSVYIPHIPGWILTANMIINIVRSGLVDNVYWKCPFCRIYSRIISRDGEDCNLHISKVKLGYRSSYECLCNINAEEVLRKYMRTAPEHDQDYCITGINLKIDEEEDNINSALCNTYPKKDIDKRLNEKEDVFIKKNYFRLDKLDDMEYVIEWKIRLKRELSLTSKPLKRIHFVSEFESYVVYNFGEVSLDIDRVVNEMLGIFSDDD